MEQNLSCFLEGFLVPKWRQNDIILSSKWPQTDLILSSKCVFVSCSVFTSVFGHPKSPPAPFFGQFWAGRTLRMYGNYQGIHTISHFAEKSDRGRSRTVFWPKKPPKKLLKMLQNGALSLLFRVSFFDSVFDCILEHFGLLFGTKNGQKRHQNMIGKM